MKFERGYEANTSGTFCYFLLLSKKNFDRKWNSGNSVNEWKGRIVSFINNFQFVLFDDAI